MPITTLRVRMHDQSARFHDTAGGLFINLLNMFDAHVHLDFLETRARAKYRRDAQREGVQSFAIPGVSPRRWPASRACALAGDAFGIGVHPAYLNDVESDLALLLEANLDSATFIGETGLDGRLPDEEAQYRSFVIHLDVAEAHGLPVVIHVVRRHTQVLASLRARPKLRPMIHGFIGSTELAKRYVDLGAVLSIGRRAMVSPKTRRAVRDIPLSHLVVETDEPDERSDIVELYAWLSKLHERSQLVVAKTINTAWLELFRPSTYGTGAGG